MQGAADVQMADHLHVAAVVVHDEQLQGDVVSRCCRRGDMKPLRLLVNMTLPPGSGHGPMLQTG